MKTIFFTANEDILDEWKKKYQVEDFISIYDLDSLNKEIANNPDSVVIADFDSVAPEINSLISSITLPKRTIILERLPEIPTGRRLINNSVKAYGNSRMLKNHFEQMYNAVQNDKVWTYPELTASLSSTSKKTTLSKESTQMIKNRLTSKEAGIVYLVLEGLTNDAISKKTTISIRTVKAHISSVFRKLHVNDRISLIFLLK